MNKNTNNNKIAIKISGEQTPVLRTIEKIETLFPLSIRSKLMPNDDGINVHCWLTVAIELNHENMPLPSKTSKNLNRLIEEGLS